MKTNATRILDARGIDYRQLEYDRSAGALDAGSVARLLGVDAGTVFKTLVARGDHSGPLVFCIPGPMELNLKKAAAVSGNKRVVMLPARELLPTTGYVRGACSPIAMIKALPTWIDETALLFEWIHISAGIHGAQIRIAPRILSEFIKASFTDLT